MGKRPIFNTNIAIADAESQYLREIREVGEVGRGRRFRGDISELANKKAKSKMPHDTSPPDAPNAIDASRRQILRNYRLPSHIEHGEVEFA